MPENKSSTVCIIITTGGTIIQSQTASLRTSVCTVLNPMKREVSGSGFNLLQIPLEKTNEIIQGYFHPNRTGVILCGNWLEPLSVVHDFMSILSSKVFNDKMCLVIVAFSIFPQRY